MAAPTWLRPPPQIKKSGARLSGLARLGFCSARSRPRRSRHWGGALRPAASHHLRRAPLLDGGGDAAVAAGGDGAA